MNEPTQAASAASEDDAVQQTAQRIYEHLIKTPAGQQNRALARSNASTLANLQHIQAACKHAAQHGPDGLDTRGALAAALVLNRADWLQRMDCSIAEALERIGPDWSTLIPAVSAMCRGAEGAA